MKKMYVTEEWVNYGRLILKKMLHLNEKAYKYGHLFDYLHEIQFEWSIDLDENRALDGIWMREDLDGFIFANPCSVLEMLSAFARRIDDEYIGEMNCRKPDIIFMEMIENLNLDQFDNNFWKKVGGFRCKSDISEILDVWMDRKFGPLGDGSPFPLRHSLVDQSKVQIWDQMLAYLNENYRV